MNSLFHILFILLFPLFFLEIFSSKKVTKKQKDIVRYINRQRSYGHSDERIRLQMEMHGHTQEQLNEHFQKADAGEKHRTALQRVSLLVLLFAVVGAVLAVGLKTPTGAAMSDWFTATTYSCGDDYPAKAKYVKDLSDCVADTSSTKNYLFCYLNNTETIAEISPNGSNDDWYLANVEEDISSVSSLGSAELLESSMVFPWTAAYDNADCFSWTHGTTRTKYWHQCNATKSADIEPPNVVFYYTDAADGSNVSYGGVSTELSLNSSYYLCYDELNCTTSTTSCDDDAGWHCVGRLDDTKGSDWYPCDTVLTAPYYRCCKGGCEGVEMECAAKLLNQEGTAYVNFTSCIEDGTIGCCDDTTDCVYNGECYDQYEVTTFYNLKMECREDNTWCPENFEYDSRSDRCEPTFETCYDSTDTAYCNSIFGTDNINTWESDSGCIRPNPEGGTYYNESCIPTTLEGIDYYFYQDIVWY